MMKKVAIDIDDTITDTSEILFYYLEKFGKVDLTNSANNKLDIMRGKITCPELLEFYKEYALILANEVRLKEGAKEALEFLKENAIEIHILSSRIPDTLSVTSKYFEKNKLPYDFLTVGVIDKKEYCQNHEINMIFDDSFETCQKIKETKTIPILFSSPINKEIVLNDIIRISNWSDLYNNEKILNLIKQ